jgi:hypothetical protein
MPSFAKTRTILTHNHDATCKVSTMPCGRTTVRTNRSHRFFTVIMATRSGKIKKLVSRMKERQKILNVPIIISHVAGETSIVAQRRHPSSLRLALIVQEGI